jgi:uncharacterized membrane protein (UPF0182 family)
VFNRVNRPTIRPGSFRGPADSVRGWRPSASTKRMLIAAAMILIVAVVLFGTSSFWINWWWFGSVGYRSVLTRNYSVKAVSFVAFGLVAAIFIFGNFALALRRTRPLQARQGFQRMADRAIFYFGLALSAAGFIVAGFWGASRWETWLLWLHGRSFGIDDPIFGRDAGFYIFSLPALSAVRSGLIALIVVTVAGVVLTYAGRLGVRPSNYRQAPRVMLAHLFWLAGLLILVVGVGYVLANYELVYSTRGAVYGVGYTDANVQRYVNYLLEAISVVVAGLLFANAFVRRAKLLIVSIGAWAVVSVFLGIFVPSAVQRTLVEPSELRRERPYIENNLEMTRAAYGLSDVTNRELSGQAPVTAQTLQDHPETLSSIRLWDYRVIRTTFQQLQSFAPYYVFNDVDVEQYTVNDELRQVLLSAREMETSGLPENAKNWTNQRLVYTRGYGAVVAPVNEMTGPGLPVLWVANVPPTGEPPLTIDRPEIYFGELTADWVIVDSDQAEFNGLSQGDASTNFQGEAKGSIKLDGFLPKLMSAVYLKSRNVFLSGAVTEDSQLLIDRDVAGRIEKIAPFLTLDPDPYLVIADGKLYWIVDAYTSTDKFPYSTPTGGLNYLRASVKVVVDAYDGTTTFYRTPTPDPLADAYGRIYSDLFRPISEVSPAIASQFRYPEHLYEVQSEIYSTYHVTDPTAFYNGEDRWAIPQEQTEEGTAQMEAFYLAMTLPQETDLKVSLIRPFTPGGSTNRQNMTSWMAGQANDDGTLRLITYRFPRQETVFGPQQIAARIFQEPEISAQITLWNQAGSRVIGGNLLVIPLDESVIYVQPLYLQATGTSGGLPELKRVIVASSERVVMRPSLDEALQALVAEGGEVVTEPPVEPPPGETAPGEGQQEDVALLSQQALEAYQAGQEALQRGDWATYGEQQAILADLLARLAAATGAQPTPAATPAAGP